MSHVRRIAERPHPMGSPDARRVAEYLKSEIERLGLEPETQAPRDPANPARNILTRVPGGAGADKGAILLSAHYDSVPGAPGAGDNAASVAALLETLRALAAGRPLRRDVIVLFDDGEERGFHGSIAFVEEHAWAKDVSLALNFDARGNFGPSFMFETSDGNGPLIREYARAATSPRASSLSQDVYKRMPNDTDLTIYKRAGMAGLNFAFAGGLAYYHSPQDTPENLDAASVQHQGQNALEFARWFGNLADPVPRGEDAVYFAVLGRWVVFYPARWAPASAIAAAAAYVLVVALAIRNRRASGRGLAAGAGVALLALVLGPLLVAGLWPGLRTAGPQVRWIDFDIPLLSAFAVVAATPAVVVQAMLARRVGLTAVGLGGLAWQLALALLTAWTLPGGSYLFLWPTLSGAVGWALIATTPERLRFPAVVGSILATLPLLLIMPPLILGLFHGLNLRMAWGLMVPVVLSVVAIWPSLSIMGEALDRRATTDVEQGESNPNFTI